MTFNQITNVQKMRFKKLLILYSTVTGHSKEAADLIAQTAERKRYSPIMKSIENYNVRQNCFSFLIFRFEFNQTKTGIGFAK